MSEMLFYKYDLHGVRSHRKAKDAALVTDINSMKETEVLNSDFASFAEERMVKYPSGPRPPTHGARSPRQCGSEKHRINPLAIDETGIQSANYGDAQNST